MFSDLRTDLKTCPAHEFPAMPSTLKYVSQFSRVACNSILVFRTGRKEMLYLTVPSIHYNLWIYGTKRMVKDRKEMLYLTTPSTPFNIWLYCI